MPVVVVHADLHIMCVPGDAFTTVGEPLGLLLETSTCDTVKAELNALFGACAAKAQGPDPDLAEGMPLVEYTEGQEILQAVVEAALLVNSSTTSVTDGPVRHLLRNMEKEVQQLQQEQDDHHRQLGTQDICRGLCVPQCVGGSCPSACCSLCYKHGIRCAYGGRRRRLTRALQQTAATLSLPTSAPVETWSAEGLGLESIWGDEEEEEEEESTPTTTIFGTKVSVEDAQTLFASTVPVISDICTKDYQAYVAALLFGG
jgi:hypothetical protein